jgi:aspartate carbamoyltransferase regulatory subunit
VKPIVNGTVIDHIEAGKSLKVLDILGNPEPGGDVVSIALKVKSERYGEKDIIKMENRYLTDYERKLIPLVTSYATICKIKGTEVVKKYELERPDEIRDNLLCINPNCITYPYLDKNKIRRQEPAERIFNVKEVNGVIEVLCYYCEKGMKGDDILKAMDLNPQIQ